MQQGRPMPSAEATPQTPAPAASPTMQVLRKYPDQNPHTDYMGRAMMYMERRGSPGMPGKLKLRGEELRTALANKAAELRNADLRKQQEAQNAYLASEEQRLRERQERMDAQRAGNRPYRPPVIRPPGARPL